ncbi:E3 ubiquitin-protein ligase PRT6 [Iris pallida]|uniref:E3 ubiquitin-protein ligase n=1 Tax=Iris pallida TaxID=29817 RepID=A0AAX6DZL7_IRIPA|nr:E3 ubiquitin-protein ligase PRT6 [Iris pallida]
MSVLFCLPLRFISSNEFFVPLVHLFYTVCVTQALITCNAGQYFDDSCFSDCVLNDICKSMGKFEFVRKYFVSNYIDFSCNSEDMIRRFTFPYLRRCALFWKLLKSSTLAPLYDSSHSWEGTTPFTNYGSLDSSECLKLELNGVRELEDMFQIHSLDSVLKDKLVHRLALKWCEHFCEDFRVRNCGLALFSLPAVPFKLIQLPRLYQDILQRYVKVKCSYCKSVPKEPALCLLCGSLCSPGWKSCCRSSRCLNHAAVCGAGIGVFLLVRRTTILLHRSLRQAFWPSPYLDAFGEEDNDVSRGRPLYLSEERYASLTYLVASHGLDRTSEVLRQTTIGLNGSD